MTSFRRTLGMLLVAALAFAGCGGSSENSASTTASSSGSLVDIGAGLQGPSGLHATAYTTGLTHAAAFAFDAQNRLWVATADYTDNGTDGVYLVAKEGARPVEVISGLHTALGLVWYHGSLYVASKEKVEVYTGLSGTHFASHRTIVALPKGVGEVNNIVVAPSGRMLVGISSPCDHCTPSSKYSGAIISFRPDGTNLTVYASGIRAPVGLTYFPNSSDLFVTMDYRDDLGSATTGDALAVVSAGSAWSNPACYGQGGTACANVPATTAVLDKHAAVSDVAIVTGQLGTTVGTAAIVAEWSLGKVQMVTLTKSGSTYTGATKAFLTGIKNPVAVILSPTGKLLVGDWTTGTIYQIAGATA
jgi:glucose/arabinose dehydrogenase